MKKFLFFLAFLIALPAVLAADLSTYPSFSPQGTLVTIVIPDNATSTEITSMSTLANALQNAGHSVTAKTASQVNISALINMHVISLGKTNNGISAAILGNDSTVVQNGMARIKYFETGSVKQIVAYGNTPADTEKAAHVLANWQTFPLKEAQVFVSGTIPTLNLSTAVLYIDYTCGGNQTYTYGQPWPQPCIGQTLLQYFPSLTSQNGQTGGSGGQTGNQTGGNQTGGSGSGNQTVTPGTSFSITAITLGDDDLDRGENASTSVTLTNTGTVALTDFTFSGIDSKYQLSIAGFPSSLASGQSATLTVTAVVPYDLDAVDNDCEENPVSIGTLTVGTTQGATATQNILMQAVNELRILDVFAVIAGEKTRVFETKLLDVYQEDDIEILVELKNRFKDDDDEEGQDQAIDVKVEAEGDTDELDLDDSNHVEVNADEEGEASLSGTVENDAKGTIKFTLTAEGEDEKGAKHCDQTVVKFNVIEGTREAIKPAGHQSQINFIPLVEEKKQAQPPATTVQSKPRQESVEILPPQTALVTRSQFRDSNGYLAIVLGMVVLLLAVIGAEIAYILHKRKHAKIALQH